MSPLVILSKLALNSSSCWIVSALVSTYSSSSSSSLSSSRSESCVSSRVIWSSAFFLSELVSAWVGILGGGCMCGVAWCRGSRASLVANFHHVRIVMYYSERTTGWYNTSCPPPGEGHRDGFWYLDRLAECKSARSTDNFITKMVQIQIHEWNKRYIDILNDGPLVSPL